MIFQKAKALGSYLIVGVYDDKVVNKLKGSNFPIMNLHERVLSVLSCRYVDEVVIGAELIITKEMIQSMRVNYVVYGTTSFVEDSLEYYKVPQEMGILKQLESPSSLTTSEIVSRILANRLNFEERNKKKQEKEIAQIAAGN